MIDAAANLAKGTHASLGTFGTATLRPIDDLASAFYLTLEVWDRPGVLASVATVFGEHGVSIRSMEQEAAADDDALPDGSARLMFITHAAREADVRATLHALRGLDAVRSVGSVLRVIGQG